MKPTPSVRAIINSVDQNILETGVQRLFATNRDTPANADTDVIARLNNNIMILSICDAFMIGIKTLLDVTKKGITCNLMMFEIHYVTHTKSISIFFMSGFL